MKRKEIGDNEYCPNCDIFVVVDDSGCCKECGLQILEPKKKPKKKK